MDELDNLILAVPTIYATASDPAHELSHLSRVYNMSMRLMDREGGNQLVIGASAWLHDLHQIPEKIMGRVLSGKDTLSQAENILIGLNFPRYSISQILHCIEVHDQYSFGIGGNSAETIEAKIIQDADNLDAIGAIGIARAFTFGGANHRQLWDGNVSKTSLYNPQKIGGTSFQHFYDKLLLLKDHMNTETAKGIAEKRHVFLEQFVNQFEKEWRGEL